MTLMYVFHTVSLPTYDCGSSICTSLSCGIITCILWLPVAWPQEEKSKSSKAEAVAAVQVLVNAFPEFPWSFSRPYPTARPYGFFQLFQSHVLSVRVYNFARRLIFRASFDVGQGSKKCILFLRFRVWFRFVRGM